MAIKVYTNAKDTVINAIVLNCGANYEFALANLVPLIDKLEIQRNLQNPKFYQRLEKDIIAGCIMPAITIAFIVEQVEALNQEDLSGFVNSNIGKAFVLDGIQRLSTLNRTYQSYPTLDLERPIFLNVIICPSMDNLLYRMITLNNGQKPMTARHQIEILASNMIDFDTLAIKVQKEKGKRRTLKGTFKKASVIKAYIAFLSNNVNIESQKIIEQKMDELLVDWILKSDITQDEIEFQDIVDLIDKFSQADIARKWFQAENNLIGFSVGAKKSYKFLEETESEVFAKATAIFDEAFQAFNVSKVKVGSERRKQSAYFVANFERFYNQEPNDLVAAFVENTTF